MDLGWLIAVPVAGGIGMIAGWWAKKPEVKPHHEHAARIADLESRTHHHAPAPEAPKEKPPVHGPDYVAWGHNVKTGKHWRRHKNGTVEHSHDGKF